MGAGVSYNEAEDASGPVIVVHICDLDGERDEDAHLRLSEAGELRDLLDRAIDIAVGVCAQARGINPQSPFIQVLRPLFIEGLEALEEDRA